MIVKVRGILLRFTDYQSEIDVDAPTVRDGLSWMVDNYPQLRDVLLDRNGAVRPTHLIALNGESPKGEELDRPAA